jgi:hypothetical protein
MFTAQATATAGATGGEFTDSHLANGTAITKTFPHGASTSGLEKWSNREQAPVALLGNILNWTSIGASIAHLFGTGRPAHVSVFVATLIINPI